MIFKAWRITRGIGLAALALWVSGAGLAQASESPPVAGAESVPVKRLILKDGSYELIRQYEVQGDRVRYFSTERHQWEALPAALIDWPATEAFAGRSANEASDRMQEALDKAARERSEEEARMPRIAPGIRIPAPNGVFLLNVYREQPELVPLIQSGADVNKNMTRNILRGMLNPVAGSRHTVELKGPRARTQAHVPTPEIYFFVDPTDAAAGYTSATAREHLRLVRCEKKKNDRVVVAFNIAVYGKVTQKAQYVETLVEPVSEYWVKIAPAHPLPPGEYALVEWDARGSVNQFVWDFGVDPLAPANAAVRRGGADRNEPVLMEKKKEQ